MSDKNSSQSGNTGRRSINEGVRRVTNPEPPAHPPKK